MKIFNRKSVLFLINLLCQCVSESWTTKQARQLGHSQKLLDDFLLRPFHFPPKKDSMVRVGDYKTKGLWFESPI